MSEAATLQPFAEAAPVYSALGLCPVPLGFDKRPAVKHWHKFGPKTWEGLVERFGGYNVGAVNGREPLPITVIDIDHIDEREWCRERFGDTPVKVRTPSGGEHWYYRSNGERRRVRFEGHKVDILGQGGYGVLPPSHTPFGLYEFVQGDAQAFADLPCLDFRKDSQKPTAAREKQSRDGRNDTLFRSLLVAAQTAVSHDALLADAHARNAEFAEPLGEREVEKTVGSVWRYKEEGRIMLPGCEPQIINTGSDWDACAGCEEAFYLLAGLKRYHGAKRGAPFKLAKGTAEKFGWNLRKFYRAREYLIEQGLLEVVQRGESGRRKATIVRLPQ